MQWSKYYCQIIGVITEFLRLDRICPQILVAYREYEIQREQILGDKNDAARAPVMFLRQENLETEKVEREGLS